MSPAVAISTTAFSCTRRYAAASGSVRISSYWISNPACDSDVDGIAHPAALAPLGPHQASSRDLLFTKRAALHADDIITLLDRYDEASAELVKAKRRWREGAGSEAEVDRLRCSHCTHCTALHAMQAGWAGCNTATLQRHCLVATRNQRSQLVEVSSCLPPLSCRRRRSRRTSPTPPHGLPQQLADRAPPRHQLGGLLQPVVQLHFR